jgi:hypothetical protein|tara:strand:+ start:16861 stop:17196 length:336 start_codon:yes stop_codon:yes gene_type:complete
MSQTYKITYFNQNSVYEIYSKEVYQSDMYGFIVVEDLVFGENTSLVVDPSEEKLKTEFQNVKRFFVPAHNIIRIDEVDKEGIAKITSTDGNIKQFPSGNFTIPPNSNNTEK